MTYKGFIKNVPAFGEFLKITNAYVYRGDPKYLSALAPLNLWYERIFKRMGLVLLVPVFLVFFTGGQSVSSSPIDLITSGYPSLLGFGIGVYALLFTIPDELLKNVCSRINKKNISIGILNVDMAYPLCVLTLTLTFAYISSFLGECRILNFTNQFFLLYGAAVMFELISSIFNIAHKRLIDIERSLKEEEKENDQGNH